MISTSTSRKSSSTEARIPVSGDRGCSLTAGGSRQTRHPGPSFLQQFDLALIKLLGGNPFHQGSLLQGILDDGQTTQDPATLHDDIGHSPDDLQKRERLDRPVVVDCSFTLAQSDQHHLVQTRLDRAHKHGVRLNPVGDEDVIGPGGDAWTAERRKQLGAQLHDYEGSAGFFTGAVHRPKQ